VPYTDPSLSLQKAIVATLKADATVSAIVGGRIYDGVPADAPLPYVSIGLFQMLPDSGECLDGGEAIIQLEGWALGPATVQAKQLGAAIAYALDQAELSLEGQHFVSIAATELQYLRDPDGITAHAVVTFQVFAEPSA
jgi:hypothetical protein